MEPSIRGRVARGLLLALAAGGCAGPAPEPFAEPPERAATAVARPEWEREVTGHTGERFRPVALRAGGGLVAMLQHAPLRRWLFVLADSGWAAAGGPTPPHEARDLHGLGAPGDVVAVDADGYAWYLDPARRRVTGEDVGGYQRVVAELEAEGAVRTACALGERAIAYLDDAREGTVLVRDLEPPHAVRALPFPDGLLSGRHATWADLRFGGSADGPCVLWAPRMRGVAVVTDTAVRAVGAFVEPLAAPRGPLARLAALSTRKEPPVGVRDATSHPGGVALLFEGATDEAGRLVDFYDDAGAYVTSLRLPRRARLVAATPHRLVVLSTREGRAFLASYLLPAAVRAGSVEAEPVVVAPPGPAGALVVDTTGSMP